MHDGWYFTGDIGYFDMEGDLFVTGRVDDLIISGGENVSPADIESVLSLHPAVAEVAAAGLPDERWGQRITAFVKRAPNAEVAGEPAALDTWCRASKLADYKRPHDYVFVPRSRNRRSARSCGGFSWPANIGGNDMTDPAPLLPALPDRFDGFRLDIDPARERADVILDRPPLSVISMAEREQLRAAFEALDPDARVRVIVLRADGEHFSSGGEIRGFLGASPEHVSHLAWNIAAPARCRKPVIAASRGYCFGVGFELALACDSGSFRKPAFIPFPSSVSARSRARAAPRACRRWWASPGPRTS